MRVFLTSYATHNFEKVQRELSQSAIANGIPNILAYKETDLKESDYYKDNKSILDEVCGAGYWAWKPYFILRALEHLADGDVLFYCDSGTMVLEPVAPLVDLCLKNDKGLITFDARPLSNRPFTKRDCFIKMGCDAPEHWDAVKVIATILVMRKGEFVVQMIQEWLGYCCDRAAITDDDNICGGDNLPGFREHRWDQAILSVLASKHSLETYRNPTVWGNFLKEPQFRVAGETIIGPYYLVPEIKDYSDTPQNNSLYGTIFLINRQPNYVGKKVTPIEPQSKKTMIERALSRIKHYFHQLSRIGEAY